MAETAIEAAIKRAGLTTNLHEPPIRCADPPRRGAAVRAVAEDTLRQARGRPEHALGDFVDRLRNDGSLMADVISEASVRYDALGYLEMVAREMN